MVDVLRYSFAATDGCVRRVKSCYGSPPLFFCSTRTRQKFSIMARPLRIQFPGAIYHVTARGNARGPIFLDHEDRQLFLGVLADCVKRFGWLCHACCLMDNDYHLLIETPSGNFSAGMRQLNGIYTQRFNRRHGRVGHVFREGPRLS
jgi:REP element-mobilizing transposase RayT